jgi:AcrB/AcrD/AcrF family
MARAGERRLRPIMMTALATVAGMVPLSLGWGAGQRLPAALRLKNPTNPTLPTPICPPQAPKNREIKANWPPTGWSRSTASRAS